MSAPRTVRMLCQGCGANLDVSEGVRFVTCNYCDAKLEVVRDESTTHTRVLESIAEDVKVIRVQNELERLDREWETEKQSYMMSGKNGTRVVPTKAGSAVGGLFILGFGIFWTVMASNAGAPVFFPLFGVVFILLGVVQCVRGYQKAETHEGGEARYRGRRRELVRKLEEAKRGPKTG